MAENLTRPYIGNPNLQRQAERARQLAQQRQAEILPDPRTYGFVRGLLGTPPEELGMSVLSPNTAAAKEAAYYGAQLSNLAQMAPALKPVAKLAGSELNAAMLGERQGLFGALTPQPNYIFIGENARTWSQANANKFLKLEKEGKNPLEIWKETGTFRAPDGQLKQEIPDNLAKLRANFDAAIANKANNYVSGIEGPIGGMLEHSELFKAYPDLLTNLRYTASKQADWLPESVAGGQYSRTIGGKEKISTSTKTEEDALSKLMHELQHAVQTREKWQSGGLESQFKDTPTKTAFEQYRALPGEVEARAVQARRTMTPEQRQQTFPLLNYDIPIENLNYQDPLGYTIK